MTSAVEALVSIRGLLVIFAIICSLLILLAAVRACERLGIDLRLIGLQFVLGVILIVAAIGIGQLLH